jgi:hypothetical protein
MLKKLLLKVLNLKTTIDYKELNLWEVNEKLLVLQQIRTNDELIRTIGVTPLKLIIDNKTEIDFIKDKYRAKVEEVIVNILTEYNEELKAKL